MREPINRVVSKHDKNGNMHFASRYLRDSPFTAWYTGHFLFSGILNQWPRRKPII